MGTYMVHSLVGKTLIGKTSHSNQDVEDEQHFLHDFPAYSDIRKKYATLFQHAFTTPDLITQFEPNVFLRECFPCRKALLAV